jgi:hypothetical protein
VNPSNKPKPADKPIDCEVLKKFTTCDCSFYPGESRFAVSIVGPEAYRAEDRASDPHAPLI